MPILKAIKGIRGLWRPVGSAQIQIKFVRSGSSIDEDFAIFEEDLPSLLSLKIMTQNGLDISIQKKEITLDGKKQEFSFRN